MQETITNVLVFKTEIASDPEYVFLENVLNATNAIQKWNLDLQDCDKVLRVITDKLSANDIVKLVNSAGLFCQELPD